MIIGIDTDKLKFVADNNGKLVVTLENLTDSVVKKELLLKCVNTTCRDCKYSVDEYGDNECYCRNRLNGTYLMYIKDWDHYCSWAERKEE